MTTAHDPSRRDHLSGDNPEAKARDVRHAAEREHAGPGEASERERRKSDSQSAAAHPVMTDTRLRAGHPSSQDHRDRPVEEEGDKDLKEGGIAGARRERQGR